MTVQVIFFTPNGVGSVHAPGVGDIRAREALSVPGVTTNTVRNGEAVVVFNGEADAVLVAHGTAPDATATAATSATSAGFPVGVGNNSDPILAATGAKISVAAAT